MCICYNCTGCFIFELFVYFLEAYYNCACSFVFHVVCWGLEDTTASIWSVYVCGVENLNIFLNTFNSNVSNLFETKAKIVVILIHMISLIWVLLLLCELWWLCHSCYASKKWSSFFIVIIQSANLFDSSSCLLFVLMPILHPRCVANRTSGTSVSSLHVGVWVCCSWFTFVLVQFESISEPFFF